MSFNVASLEAFRDKGLSLSDVIDILSALEGRRERIPQTPDNDRVRRMTSEQRRRIFAILCERDGDSCAQCGEDNGVIWRRMGVSNNGDWDWDDQCRNLVTRVWPTSSLEVDHRTPIWAGGDNHPDNLWLLCIGCHKKKTAIEASQRRRA